MDDMASQLIMVCYSSNVVMVVVVVNGFHSPHQL